MDARQIRSQPKNRDLLNRLKGQFNFGGFPGTIWAVAAMQCIGGTGFATAFTYLPLYLYKERGIPMTQVGILMLVSGLSSGIFQIIGGILGDRFGHRRTALSFSAASVTAAAFLAASIALRAPVWTVLVLAALRQSLGSGGSASMNAIIANAAPKNRMTESYSLLAMIGNISWAIGPLLGGFLLGFASFGWLFSIAVGLLALGLLGFRFLPSDSRAEQTTRRGLENLKAAVPNPAFLMFGIFVVLFFLTLAQWGATLSVFTIERLGFTTADYGLLMSISSIMIIAFQYPISHMMAGRPRAALVLGCLFYAFGFLSLAWVKSFGPAIGSIAVMVTGEMLFIPSAISVVGQMGGPEDKGKAMGFYGLCSTLGISMGPLLGGFLLDRFQNPLLIWGPVWLSAFLGAIGFGVWRGYGRRAQPPEPTSPLNRLSVDGEGKRG